MKRRLVIALACATLAMSGCATWVETSENTSSTGGSASPAVTPPTPLAPNAFRPEVPHYFGSGGP
jgi:protein involved in sex pheromone biosynthesis